VVVVSADAFNASRIETVVVVGPHLEPAARRRARECAVRPTEAGLPTESVANVSQVLTVDKDVLTARAGQLRPATLEQVAAGLRLALDL
jgi:mRNA interferase MazF